MGLTSCCSGLGAGIAQSAVFVALQVAIDPSDKAAATSALFLIGTIAIMTGIAIAGALIVGGLQKSLFAQLTALGLNSQLIQEVTLASLE
jgi:hypothetical protein